jgi:hypothetical protein
MEWLKLLRLLPILKELDLSKEIFNMIDECIELSGFLHETKSLELVRLPRIILK